MLRRPLKCPSSSCVAKRIALLAGFGTDIGNGLTYRIHRSICFGDVHCLLASKLKAPVTPVRNLKRDALELGCQSCLGIGHERSHES